MSILHTPTPNYQGQDSMEPEQPSQGFLGWLTSLFRTPTPVYQTAPAAQPSKETQQAKQSER
jgi:hypothetical protein